MGEQSIVMRINWLVVVTVAGPVLAVLLGAWLSRVLERRPRLITWLGHASAIQIRPPQGQPMYVHTHAVVVRNVGRRPATNVRIGHNYLPPDFSIYPSVNFQVNTLPAGGAEVVFPVLVPNKQITITYLYYPPVTWGQVNAYTKSDEGLARVISVLPAPQPPRWFVRTAWVLIFVGFVASVHLLIQFGLWLMRVWPR